MNIENALLNALTTPLDDKVYVIAEQYKKDYPTSLSMALLVRIDSRKNNVGYTFKYAVMLMDLKTLGARSSSIGAKKSILEAKGGKRSLFYFRNLCLCQYSPRSDIVLLMIGAQHDTEETATR